MFNTSVDIYFLIFFFFQAEDGIRDKLVTGVQTCALPILVGDRDVPEPCQTRARWAPVARVPRSRVGHLTEVHDPEAFRQRRVPQVRTPRVCKILAAPEVPLAPVGVVLRPRLLVVVARERPVAPFVAVGRDL